MTIAELQEKLNKRLKKRTIIKQPIHISPKCMRIREGNPNHHGIKSKYKLRPEALKPTWKD